MKFKFALGEVLMCKITGFIGVCMARTQYQTGCNSYGLFSKDLGKDGTPKDWSWFDQNLLRTTCEIVEDIVPAVGTGGLHPNAPQR